jgi:predicted nucleic-acid-binding Zn-ribbon protein
MINNLCEEITCLKEENANLDFIARVAKEETKFVKDTFERLKSSGEGVRELKKQREICYESYCGHISGTENLDGEDRIKEAPEPEFLSEGEEKKEEPKFECVDCKWTGTDREKVRLRESEDFNTLTCPECGQTSFYNIDLAKEAFMKKHGLGDEDMINDNLPPLEI